MQQKSSQLILEAAISRWLFTRELYTCLENTSHSPPYQNLFNTTLQPFGHIWSRYYMNWKRRHPEITYIHFFSDGPTTQYRNKTNFYFFSTVLHQMGYHAATWNFFESGHGKGAPDGIGGSVKRQADSWVSSGVDLPSAQKLFDFLKCGNSTIQFYFIASVEITEFDALWPSSLKPISGTMKVHQLHTDDKFSMSYRNLSCFCQRPTLCCCYNLHWHKFPPEEPHIVSSLHLLICFAFININSFCVNLSSGHMLTGQLTGRGLTNALDWPLGSLDISPDVTHLPLSLIHISEPTRPY